MGVEMGMMRWLKSKTDSKNSAVLHITSKPQAKGKLDVVRTLTLPDGKKIRVIRQDAFDRSLARRSHPEVA